MMVGIALRNLLVDLHRLAGADRLEGTRAGLRPAPRADRRSSTAPCPPSPTRSSWRSSPTTTSAKAEVDGATRRPSREAQPAAAAVATAEPRPSGDGGAGASANGETAGGGTGLGRAPPSATPSAASAASSAASTGGIDELMALLVWFTMGIALWHFTVFLPDRFWQGIVGAFLGAVDRRGRSSAPSSRSSAAKASATPTSAPR